MKPNKIKFECKCGHKWSLFALFGKWAFAFCKECKTKVRGEV